MRTLPTLFFWIVFLFPLGAFTQSINKQANTVNPAQGAPAFHEVDFASGNVIKDQFLLSVKGFTLSIQYSSEGVERKASTRNLDASTGILGLGWSISRNRIVRENKGTGNELDDTYHLNIGGGIYKLLYIDQNDQVKNYRIGTHPDWLIKYHKTQDQWEVLRDDGVRFLYGDGELNQGYVANSTEYFVHWGNWIGNSGLAKGQQQKALAWNVSSKENMHGQLVKFHYTQAQEQVGEGLPFTKATYLDTITGYEGEKIILIYERKDNGEYVDPHQKKLGLPDNDQDAYQERFEKMYLSKVSLLNFYGEVKDVIELSYDFLSKDKAAFKKRVLNKIHYKNPSGQIAEPPTVFDYYGLDSLDRVKVDSTDASTILWKKNGALFGALKSTRIPEGATYTYRYHKKTIENSQREIDLIFPKDLVYTSHKGIRKPTGWNAPELIFAGTYVVAIYEPIALDCFKSRLQVYEWLGDHWTLAVDEPLEGLYFDNYKALDQIDPSTINKIKSAVLGEVNKVVPTVGGLMNAFGDALKDNVQGAEKVAQDLAEGRPDKAIEDYFKGELKLIEDVGEDILSGFENMANLITEAACEIFDCGEFEYVQYQKELYKKKAAFEAKHPRREYHITAQKDFFAITSYLNKDIHIYRKDPIVEGNWIQDSLSINISSKYFQIQSGERFITVLDKMLDMVHIYTWDGMNWVHGIFTLTTGHEIQATAFDYSEDSLAKANAVNSHASHVSSIATNNNFIVATMKDKGYRGALKAWLIYHDEDMNWHVNSEPVKDSLPLSGAANDVMNFLFGENGEVVIQAGKAFAGIQTYSHLSKELPTAEDIPVAGTFVGDFVPDSRKMNTTYGFRWDENFENLELDFLHMGRAQTDIGIQVNGDVINKVGKAHSLEVGSDNKLFPDDGKNHAFRYNGFGFLGKQFESEYHATAFGEDISSAVRKAGVTGKSPQFYQFDPNQMALKAMPGNIHAFNNALPKFSTLKASGDTEALKQYASKELFPALSAVSFNQPDDWSLVEALSNDTIPTGEELAEITNTIVDGLSLLAQIVMIEIPGFGEEMALEEESMEAVEKEQSVLKTGKGIVSKVNDAVFILQPLVLDLIESLMKPSPYGSSVMDNYISVNGDLYTRKADESWISVSQHAFDNKQKKLIGTGNKILPGYYPFTLKDSNDKITNEVILLKNGTLYKKIELHDPHKVVHEDSLSQVAGNGAFVSYGPLDPVKPGYVLPNPQRQLFFDLIDSTKSERDSHAAYKDAGSVRLHRVIQNGVEGKLYDYVLSSVEIDDGYESHSHNFLYESGQFNASSGSAIYGKVVDLTSQEPISELNTENYREYAQAGFTEHFFYNRYNYYSQQEAVGFPQSEKILLKESIPLVEYQSYFPENVRDFDTLAIKAIFAHPWMTASYESKGIIPVEQNLSFYKLWEVDFYHPIEDKQLKETRVHLVNVTGNANIKDGVVTRSVNEYDPIGYPGRLRSVSHISLNPDGSEEKTTSQYTYAFEYYNDLRKENRKKEIKNTTTFYQKGEEKIIYTGATSIAYDTLQYLHHKDLPKAIYAAKLSTDLNRERVKDYVVNASPDVAGLDLAIENYEEWLAEVESAKGHFNLAKMAAKAGQAAAQKSHEQMMILKAELPQIKQSRNLDERMLDGLRDSLSKTKSRINWIGYALSKLEREYKDRKKAIEKKIQDLEVEIANRKQARDASIAGCWHLPFVCLAWVVPLTDEIKAKEKNLDEEVREREKLPGKYQGRMNSLIKERDDLKSKLTNIISQINSLESTIQEKNKEREIAKAAISNINDLRDIIQTKWDSLHLASGEAFNAKDHGSAQEGHLRLVPKFAEIKSHKEALRDRINQFISQSPDSLFVRPESLQELRDTLATDSLDLHLGNVSALSGHHEKLARNRKNIVEAKASKPKGKTSKWIENKEVFYRDTLTGVPLSWENSKNTRSSMVLDKYHRNIVVQMKNVDLQEKEAFYYGFEPYENISAKQSSRIYTEDAHTGDNSFKAGLYVKYEFSGFKPRDEVYSKDGLYVVSAWVKKRSFLNGRFTVKSGKTKERIKVRGKKKWQYVEQLIREPDSINSIKLGLGCLLVDDLMLRPINTIAHSSVYDPHDKVISEIDNNGLAIRHVYDGHHRHLLSVDDAGRVHYFTHHSYSASEGNSFQSSRPNGMLSIHFQGEGKLLSRHKKKGYVHQEIHPALDDYVISFNLLAGESSSFVIYLNDALLSFAAGSLSFNSQPIAQRIGSPETWVVIKTGGYLYVYGDGRLLQSQPLQLNTVTTDQKIMLDGKGLSDVFVGLDPVLQQHYLDGLGREIQSQHLEYGEKGQVIGKVVNETLYDGWGNVIAHSLNAFIDTPLLSYEPQFIQSFEKGQLSGDIVSYFDQQNEITDLSIDDGKYAYQGFSYESSPLHRIIRNIPPGAFFHHQPDNQQKIGYQNSLGFSLAQKIGIKPPDDKQFPNSSTQDPNHNKHLSLHDGHNRLIASQQGNAVTKHEYLYRADSILSMTYFPNYFENHSTQKEDSSAGFIHSQLNKDLLGLFQVDFSPDLGALTTIKDHGGNPAFHIRNNVFLGREGSLSASDHYIEYYKYDQLNRPIEEGIDTANYDFALLETMANARFWYDEEAHTYRTWNYDWDGEGNTLHLLGRLSKSIHEKGDTVSETYEYNIHGQPTKITQRIYGPSLNLAPQSILYAYFPDGKLKSITYPNQDQVLYSYDKLGRMQGVGTVDNAFQYAKYAYTVNSQIKEIQVNNNAFQERLSYTLQSHISARSYQTDEEILFRQQFTTNNQAGQGPYLQGLISAIKEEGSFQENSERKFYYDDQYRLDSVLESFFDGSTSYLYSYDANGNLKSYTSPSGKRQYSYQPGKNIRQGMTATNGLISSFHSPTSQIENIEYDLYTFMPLKVSARSPEKVSAEFLYDAHNNRVAKTLSSDTATETLYYIRGGHSLPLAEIRSGDPEGNRNLIYGVGFAPLASVDEGNKNFFHLRDYLGSLRYALNQDNDQVAAYDYTPFGEVIASDPSSTVESPTTPFSYLYTGQEYDAELGLHNYRARLYSPTEKIFLSPDPIREGASLYTYVGNDPINHTDPTGLVKFNKPKGLSKKAHLSKVKAPKFKASSGPAPDPKITRGTGNKRIDIATFRVEPQHLGKGTATNEGSRKWVRSTAAPRPTHVSYHYKVYDGNTGSLLATYKGSKVKNDLNNSRYTFPDAGHIRARSMGGSGTSPGNLFAQQAELNRGLTIGNKRLFEYWRKAERNVVRDVKKGDLVDVEIQFYY